MPMLKAPKTKAAKVRSLQTLMDSNFTSFLEGRISRRDFLVLRERIADKLAEVKRDGRTR